MPVSRGLVRATSRGAKVLVGVFVLLLALGLSVGTAGCSCDISRLTSPEEHFDEDGWEFPEEWTAEDRQAYLDSKKGKGLLMPLPSSGLSEPQEGNLQWIHLIEGSDLAFAD